MLFDHEPQVNNQLQTTIDIEPRRSERINKGIPKLMYEQDIKYKAKYPIFEYVYAHRLSESHTCTIDQLSSVFIPSNLQEAPLDPR